MRAALALVLAVVLAAGGLLVVPRGSDALQLRLAADDPAALASLRLRAALTAAGIDAAIRDALESEDADLAASFVALADERDLAVDPAQRTAVQAARQTSPVQVGFDFVRGFALCAPGNLAETAGTAVGDVLGYGDLCDLAREGAKAWRGEANDQLVVGLAVVGLAVTGATWLSLGTALPARGGVSVIKAVRKTGHLSAPLARFAGRAAREAVDDRAVKAAVAAAARLDVAGTRLAARSALRPQGLRSLAALAHDAGVLHARIGFRGVRQGLALAENGDDLRRMARLAEAKGPSTRAILKTLGRGALVLGGVAGTLAAWSLALAGYILVLVWAALGVLAWLLRRLLPRRRVRMPAKIRPGRVGLAGAEIPPACAGPIGRHVGAQASSMRGDRGSGQAIVTLA